MIDFSQYQFRASQCHLLMTGTIGLSEKEEETLKSHLKRKKDATLGNLDDKGKKIKPLPPGYATEMANLLEKRKDKTLPKTMRSELRKIHRSVMHNRNFSFINKFTQKGIVQENECITLYQKYLNRDGLKVAFTKNEERIYNDYTTGLPDLKPVKLDGVKTGFDVKSSWELETFPFEIDDLPNNYEWQNQDYMWLTDSEEWITAYGLVNIHEHGLNNEKLKYWYPLGCPSNEDDEYYFEYVEKCKELEIRLLFDYERFVTTNPFHQMAISKDEWMETVNPATGIKGYDMALSDRIIEKKSIRDDEKIESLKERIEISRDFLTNLK